MFRYKICYHCKDLFVVLLIAIAMTVIIVYILLINNMVYNLLTCIHAIVMSIPLIVCVVLNITHYKEHQKEQFNKILKKFNV